MFPRTRSLALATLSLVAGLALALPGLGHATSPALPVYSVSPNPAPSDKAFSLSLFGANTDCFTVFSRENVIVTGKRIDLSYVATSSRIYIDPLAGTPADTNRTGVLCPDTLKPVVDSLLVVSRYAAPTFAMAALAAGTYEVWVTQHYECQYSTPACLIASQPVSAGKLVVQPQPAVSYTITPKTTDANKAFALGLLSYQFNCGTAYSNLSTSVSGNTITLTFLDKPNIGIACPAIYAPYGPTFKMEGLKAGKYTVIAYRLPACYPCKMAGDTATAGTLTVGGPADRAGWFLKEPKAPAGKPFTMQLLNNDYGNCGISFTHKSVATDSGRIFTSFLIETQKVVCIVDLHPNGPEFAMQSMKAGIYPVYVTTLLECQVTAPFCALSTIPPTPSDTLVVTPTVSISLSELRARAPRVDLVGSKASFRLPDGIGGTWKSELMTVSGRRLSAAPLSGAGGDAVAVDLGADLKPGVYLLRLSAPDGETHLLPVVRN